MKRFFYLNFLRKSVDLKFGINLPSKCIQGVFEIRVLILTSGRTRQIMELFFITFLRKSNTN
jgi:hypothetical protein